MGSKNVVLTSFVLFLTLVTLALIYSLYAVPRVQIIIIQTQDGAFKEQNDGIRYQLNEKTGKQEELKATKEEYEKKKNVQSKSQCAVVDDDNKFDCYPETSIATKEKCEARGCCWQAANQTQTQSKGLNGKVTGVPFCYYPKDFSGYKTGLKATTPTGFTVALSRNTTGFYPDDVMNLVMDIKYETEYRLRIRIYDPKNARYEVPLDTPKVTKAAPIQRYSVIVSNTGDAFNFAVTRKMLEPGQPVVLFNTSGAAPLIFADQFIQLSTFLPTKCLYGLGEHRGSLLHSMDWRRLTTWNRDQAPHDADTGTNLYGHHPFYLMMEDGGRSHGFFLLNSNAKETALQPAPALTWRTIGGVLDLYMFMGPSPSEVVQQYTEVIGRSFMPPYWSLGFHLCKYGYHSVNETMAVVKRMQEAKIPQDTQWNDIDYMDQYKDFTIGTSKFGDQAGMVNTLHSMGMHYVMIVDPGISNKKSSSPYPPYDVGTKMDIWIKDSKGVPLVGKVWPGDVVFPDFTNPKAYDYWTQMTKAFHDQVQFDGMWIDMNELSNFYDGSLTGCPGNKYDNPPYVPAVLGGQLKAKTICPSAQQNFSLTYNVHDLYGLTETMATYQALKTARAKRPLIISRSTFAGQGHYGGHWSGDNFARYEDMAVSIPEMLNMNIFGISMIGADICGFHDDTTEQLCQRWQQLGAFYPFSRNHNDLGKKPQDPAVFSDAMKNSTRTALSVRYSLLPYLYTLFHKSNAMGETVARPLFFEFPEDTNTYVIDDQFLWGSALMITPVLTKDTTALNTYFPACAWYDFYTGLKITGSGSRIKVNAPMSQINLYVRGGNILPMVEPAMTTTESRKNNFRLLVALNETGQANGGLFWDDGETIGTHDSGVFNMIMFSAGKNFVSSEVMKAGYTREKMTLDKLTVYGMVVTPKSVTVNGKGAQFQYNSPVKTLTVSIPLVDLLKPFSVKWM